MNQDSLTHFVKSRWFAAVIAIIGFLLIASCIFEAGIFVGFREAQFSARWGQNYQNNFGGGMFGMDGHMPYSHGAFGKIVDISASSSSLTIVNGQQQEQKVQLGGDTIIRDRESNIPASELANGMYVVVVGRPDNGEIDAELIRVVPAPPVPATTSSTSPKQ